MTAVEQATAAGGLRGVVAGRLAYGAGGGLVVDGVPVADLLDRLGTPSLVFVPGQVRDNLAALQAAVARHFAHSRCFYAMKACYLPPVLGAARSAGAGVEIMSELELDLAVAAGFSGDDLVVNGLGRTRAFTDAAAAQRPALMIVDSAEDLAATDAAARRLGGEVRVGLRLAGGAGHGEATKLGLRAGREFLELARAVEAAPNLRLEGLLTHQFAHLTDPQALRLHLADVVRFVDGLRAEHGIAFRVLDIGGGFAGAPELRRAGVTVDDLVDAAAAGLAGLDPSTRVITEPGRFAVADAAVGLTRVVARKQRDGFCWLVVDLATNVLVPIPGSWFPPVPLVYPGGAEGALFRLGDRSCAVTEVFGEVVLPADVSELAVLGAGAYTTSFAHVWGPPSPVVAAVDDGRVTVLTDAAGQRRAALAMHGWAPGIEQGA